MDSPSKKRHAREFLAARNATSIGEAEWKGLLEELAPVSESYLRDILRGTGLPFAQPWAGVGQHTFEELEETLLELRAVYAAALAAGDRDRARYCRRQVIAAKDRARYLSRKHPEKGEMVEWMLVWLGDPEVFAEWVRIRKGQASRPAP